MKRRNLLKILSLIGAFGLSLGLTSCGGGCSLFKEKVENGIYDTEYVVEYGEQFSMPYTVRTDYEVFDSKGKEVSVFDGKFVATDVNGYTVKVDGGEEIKIKIKDTKAPIVKDFPSGYVQATVGQEFKFDEVTAYDECSGYLLVEFYEKKNGTEKLLTTPKFTPNEVGRYEIIAKATDNADNVTEKSLVVEALEENDEKFDRLTVFSDEYGVTQVTALHGLTATYSTSHKYGEEQGSLKLSSNWDLATGSYSSRFQLSNLFDNDISDTYGLYFRAKYTGAVGISLSVEDSYSTFSLTPGEWTEIYISKKDFAEISFEHGVDNVAKDLSELVFKFSTIESERMGFADVYLSDFYVMPRLDTSKFMQTFEELKVSGIVDEKTENTWKKLERAYSNYIADGEISTLTTLGYSEEVINSLYLESMSEKFNVEHEEFKVTYHDSELAPYQFRSKDNSAVMSYDPTMSCTTNGRGEVGSMKVRVGDAWGSSLTLAYPFVTADYSTYNLDDYEDALYGTVSFSIFVEDEYNKSPVVSYGGVPTGIKSGEWVNLTLKLNNRSLQANTLYVYASADSGPGTGGWLNDTTFWITSFYVTLCRTAEEVDTLIEELVEADVPAEEFAENELYLKTMEAFSELSPIKRTFVTKSQEFKNLLKEKIGGYYGVAEDPKKVLYFDTEVGVYQIKPLLNTKVEYTESMKYEGDLGNGCLKVTFTGNVWEVGFDTVLPFETERTKAKAYRFYVYMDGSKGQKINFTHWNDGPEDFYLEEKEWTLVEFKAGYFLDEDRLIAYANDWMSRVPNGLTLYFSAVEVVE
jgi:hypothetical protein